jgi:hypothetical protein
MSTECKAVAFRLTLVAAGALWLGQLGGGGLAAQSPARLRVSVQVEDDSIGGVISSGFRSAFRSLGDIDVVSAAENPDVVLEGVVLCVPECASNWSAVHLSLRLWAPVTRSLLVSDLAFAGIRAADSSVAKLSAILSGAQFTRNTWVATWGRSKYDAEARTLVATIDSRCLEEIRRIRRIQAMPEVKAGDAAFRALLAQPLTAFC